MVSKLSTGGLNLFRRSTFTIHIQCIFVEISHGHMSCWRGSASRTDPGSSSYSHLTRRLILHDGTEVAHQARSLWGLTRAEIVKESQCVKMHWPWYVRARIPPSFVHSLCLKKHFFGGNVPIGLIFFRWVEATTEISIQWWQACTGDLPRYNSLAYGLFWSPTAWSQYSHDQGSNGDRNWDHTWPWHPSLPWNRIRICSIPFLHVLRSPRVLFHDGWLQLTQFTEVSEMSVMISDSQVFKDSKHISTSLNRSPWDSWVNGLAWRPPWRRQYGL